MNYQETLDFLFSRLPMFQNVGKVAFKKDLTNTLHLLDFLGNPHEKTAWIHVGGTNGKGSVSSTIASVFKENGYSVGLYTSPHLIDFRERIQVNGVLIEKEFIIDFTKKIRPIIEEIQPSFFELTVAMAFDYFKFKKIEIGIIEVGLGGRLDSTNVIHPILSIITNVSWDHMDMLGDTLTKIAFEKGGIIKSSIPVVLGEMENEAIEELERQARLQTAPIIYGSKVAVKKQWEEHFQLKGIYQKENLKTIVAALSELQKRYSLHEKSILTGLSNITANSGLRGRWDVLSEKPYIVADTAHNYPGVQQTMQQLSKIVTSGKLHIIWGMVADKDRSKILTLLPRNAKYYFCKPSVVRGLDAIVLCEDASTFGLIGNSFSSVQLAVKEAMKTISNDDILYIGGSTFVVADAIPLFQ